MVPLPRCAGEEQRLMRILVTNDDGIHAPGLMAAEKIARALSDDVWVVAPETDQSGVAHSLTLSDPLRMRRAGERRFAVRGTPTDCVIMALKVVIGDRPDLVLSGVNGGANIADDVTYSGTVAGAMEGTLLGIPSFALSQAYAFHSGDEPDYATAEAHGPGLIHELMAAGIPDGTVMNVNFPACPPDAVAGRCITRQGKRVPDWLKIEERRDGRGHPYYWIGFRRARMEPEEGTDLAALANGLISVTPLSLDLTNERVLEKLRAALG
jgi:5'-nucleotidase